MIDLEAREYFKDQHLRQEQNAGLEDVVTAVLNIYQSELGHWIEDEEAYGGLVDAISALAVRHSVDTEDNEKLVDKILEEIADDAAPGQALN